jgi:hypothetical protein
MPVSLETLSPIQARKVEVSFIREIDDDRVPPPLEVSTATPGLEGNPEAMRRPSFGSMWTESNRVKSSCQLKLRSYPPTPVQGLYYGLHLHCSYVHISFPSSKANYQ